MLLAAARVGAAHVVEGLVRNGVHVAIVDSDRNSPLHIAIQERHEVCACALVDLGAVQHPLARNAQWMSPVELSCQSGLPSVFRKLRPTAGDWEAARGHMAGLPLVQAARDGWVEEVERLVGVEPLEATTRGGCTALSVAAENGAVDVVAALCAARADVNRALSQRRETSLLLAVRGCHLEAAGALLAAEADPRAVDWAGYTALHWAAQFGRVELVQELLRAEARVDARTTKARGGGVSVPGRTPLMFAGGCGHAGVCEALLAADASPLATDSRGWTVLHCASCCVHAGAAVRFLVAARADLEAQTSFFFRFALRRSLPPRF